MRTIAWPLVAAVCLLLGPACDGCAPSTSEFRCEADADCETGSLCVEGECRRVVFIDGGPRGDGGPGQDAGRDGGVDADAGADGGVFVDGGVDGGVDAGADAGVFVDAGLDGGLVDGGLVDGGLVDGGLVDGGLVDGGLVDGGFDAGDPFDGGAPPTVDCSAVTVRAGEVDCASMLSTATQWCANVMPPSSPFPVGPDLELIEACATCDARFYRVPEGVDCIPEADGGPALVDQRSLAVDERCTTCHAPWGYDGPDSLEDPHPAKKLKCTECHGGDPTATDKIFAHVCPPAEVGDLNQQVLDRRAFFLASSLVGIERLADYDCATFGSGTRATTALQWLAFRNPGDLRVGPTGTGCVSCHVDEANRSRLSLHATNAGVFGVARHNAGIDNTFADRRDAAVLGNDWLTLADVGVEDLVNPQYAAPSRVVGEVPSLSGAEEIATQDFRFDSSYTASLVNGSPETDEPGESNYPNGNSEALVGALFQSALNQACAGCHLNSAGTSWTYGAYRTSGCTTCHFRTALDGRSRSHDPSIDKGEPAGDSLAGGERSHLRDHRMVNTVRFPGQRGAARTITLASKTGCKACHYGSNATAAQYEGRRVDQNQDLVNLQRHPIDEPIVYRLSTGLFDTNLTFNNRVVEQWIETEVWQRDVNDLVGTEGQDETPADLHHDAGLGCVDCHGLGVTHGTGKLFGRMKAEAAFADVRCETCHGTLDGYAANDGTHLLDEAGDPLLHTRVGDPLQGDYFLISKVSGRVHYLPQTRDVVNPLSNKDWPDGTTNASQPLFNRVASYAMGRWQSSPDNGDGFGPAQRGGAAALLANNFSHSDGRAYDGDVASEGHGLACQTCHSAWQNNCTGCHLTSQYDNNENNFFYSSVTGERVYLNVSATVLLQDPINFLMGIDPRGRISPWQRTGRFFSYVDRNSDASNQIAWGDRNGLGNDPQLNHPSRNDRPALAGAPFAPHSTRSAATTTAIGVRGCLDCHLGSTTDLRWHDQNDNPVWQIETVYSDRYLASAQRRVRIARGLGSGALNQLDANGVPVALSFNEGVYDLDRIVEPGGVSNTGGSHPLLDPFGMNNAEYVQVSDTDGAFVTRPLTSVILSRLAAIDGVGLSDVYYSNLVLGQDPNTSDSYVYVLSDYSYVP